MAPSPFVSLTFIAIAIAAAACSQGLEPEHPTSQPSAEAEPPPLEAGRTSERSPTTTRRVGDVRVVRFSGTFRDSALILREEVVELGEHTVTIDYTLDDGFEPTTLRVVHTKQSERIVEVTRLEGSEFLPATAADFDDLLARTTFAPSQNRGVTSTDEETCLIGQDEYTCSVEQYAVLIGDQEATLTVSRTNDQDVSGEVVAVDGTLLYRARTLELHREQEATPRFGTGIAQR